MIPSRGHSTMAGLCPILAEEIPHLSRKNRGSIIQRKKTNLKLLPPGVIRMEQSDAKKCREGATIIRSEERLTIETIGTFTQLIRRGFAEASTVIIEFQPKVAVDLTALQTLCSACKTAALMGKKLLLNGSLPESLQQLMSAAGSLDQGECNISRTGCFLKLGGAR